MTNDDRFEAIYRKYYARLWRYYRRCRVSDDESHDLAQDVFKLFYQRFHQFRGSDEAVWPFLEAIALNVLRNWIRAGKTLKRSANMVYIDDPDFAEEPAAPEQADYAERDQMERRRNRLREAIAELPDGQRQCLQLRMRGFQYDEIARDLRITMDAVKSRLRDAKKHLHARVGDQS